MRPGVFCLWLIDHKAKSYLCLFGGFLDVYLYPQSTCLVSPVLVKQHTWTELLAFDLFMDMKHVWSIFAWRMTLYYRRPWQQFIGLLIKVYLLYKTVSYVITELCPLLLRWAWTFGNSSGGTWTDKETHWFFSLFSAETITQQSSERAHKIPVRVEHFPVAPSFHNQYKRQKNEESAQGFIVSAAIVKEG